MQDREPDSPLRLSELKAGEVVIADRSINCLAKGGHVLQADEDGDLFVACRNGKHYLDGQLAFSGRLGDDALIGLRRAEAVS